VPRDENMTLPARHLGLIQAGEHPDLQTRLDHLGTVAERYIDLDAVMAKASPLALPPINASPSLPPPGQRIALARDVAFSFVYPHVLHAWRGCGAEIVPFSPLADEPPPADCDSCWLPGGYPELHAAALSAAHRFRNGLCQFAATRPVHGECGGYMVLGESLEDGEGQLHAMTGLLGHTTSFARRTLHLGYREARLCADGPLGPAGAVIRGHEFHYASLGPKLDCDEPFTELLDGNGNALGKAGGRRGLVTGTFFHAIADAGSL
jgi:cobyrinic acid a,c-diamide synthase